jgi:hypothetical protein
MAKQKRVRTPTSGWHEIASGDIGDILYWKPGYEVLQHAEGAIGLLHNLKSDAIDWDQLIHRLPRFAPLPVIVREGYFGFLKWGEIDGFHAIEGDRQEETGSMSGEWTHMWLEMDHSEKRVIFRDFDTLSQRLAAYPPLQSFI